MRLILKVMIHNQIRCRFWIERLSTLHVQGIAKVSTKSLVAWALDLRGLRSLLPESLVMPATLRLLGSRYGKIGGMTCKASCSCPILLAGSTLYGLLTLLMCMSACEFLLLSSHV